MRALLWIAGIAMFIVLVAAVEGRAPVTTIGLIAGITFAIWLVIAKQADLDDAASSHRTTKIMCGTCHLEFDNECDYNNHVYELGDDHDSHRHP